MILNDTKPPLEEALVHYGVPGMKWGRRRARSRDSSSNDYDELSEQDRHDRNKRRVAAGALVAAGTIATVVVLHKTGHVKISPALIASGKAAASKMRPLSPSEESARAKDAFRKAADSARATGKEYDDAYRDAGRKAYGAYKKSNFANRTFRPENVGNPLWTRSPKAAKSASDFVDAGFGKDGVFNVTTMAKGSQRVKDFNSDIWDVPMLAITSGRRKG